MKRFEILGRLTKDAESKNIGEINVCNFTLAVNEKRKEEEKTHYFDCVVFNENLINVICKYVKKGDLVIVSGELSHHIYETKDGKKHSRVDFVVDTIELLPNKK